MTTENSRPDALTDDFVKRAFYAADCKTWYEAYPSAAMDVARAILAASPVEQPAAAPIDDARECLTDVVSHHDNIVAGFSAQRLAAEEAQDTDTAAYWKREIDVAHRMKAQAERALAAMAQPAPSPADERAAQMAHDLRCAGVAGTKAGDLLHAAAAMIEALARAASANETGAEAQKPFGWAQPRGGNYFTRNESSAKRIGGLVPVYAAPQPAQADARVGPTDGRIARLRAAIEGECDGLHVDYHHAKAILAYLDDDRA